MEPGLLPFLLRKKGSIKDEEEKKKEKIGGGKTITITVSHMLMASLIKLAISWWRVELVVQVFKTGLFDVFIHLRAEFLTL